MEKTKNQKKRFTVVAAVLCLALAAGLGTYAWLTATSSLTNTFTVGSINQPDKKPDPDQPDKPGSDDVTVKSNLIETKWVDNSKLTPGATIAKNPNVGIGAGSDNAYVFVYVKNALVTEGTAAANTPYFTIDNTKWQPVNGEVTTNGNDAQYISGLFMYAANQGGPALVTASADADVYTGELFSNVTVPSTLTKDMVSDGKTMTVSCYIFGDGQQGTADSNAANALTQAKAWAESQK